MYPNLRYAFYDIFGIDLPFLALVQTYGFLLALAFLVSGILLTLDFKRREKVGLLQGVEEEVQRGQQPSPLNLGLNAFLAFIMGFKGLYAVMNTAAFTGAQAKENLLSLEHGTWLGGLGALALFVFLRYREYQQEKAEFPQPTVEKKMVFPHERVSDIIVVAAVMGVIGAKLLYVIDYSDFSNPDKLMSDLFSGSGLTIYGGLILASVSVVLYAKSKKIDIPQLIDSTAPIVPMAYGIGRLGCHFSGDGDWGVTNPHPKPYAWLPDWLWGYSYPNNVIAEGVKMSDCFYPADFGTAYCSILENPVYPTPIYEFALNCLIFALLWSMRKHIKAHGLLFAIYLFLNGLERYSIELIRINDKVSGDLTEAQVIAIILMIAGLISMAWMGKKQWDMGKEKEQS